MMTNDRDYQNNPFNLLHSLNDKGKYSVQTFKAIDPNGFYVAVNLEDGKFFKKSFFLRFVMDFR